MGLPARYHDKTHGECLSLIAALSHLKQRGVTYEQSGQTIRYTTQQRQRQIEVNPVAVPIGKMYRLEELNQ